VQKALVERRPEGSDPQSAFVAWVPLTNCMQVVGKSPPFVAADEIITETLSFSNGHFRHDGCRQRTRLSSLGSQTLTMTRSTSAATEGQMFHEWQIIVCEDEREEQRQGGLIDDEQSAMTPDNTGTNAQERAKQEHDETIPDMTPGSRMSEDSEGGLESVEEDSPSNLAAHGGRKGGSLWKSMQAKLVLDRFCLQLRTRDQDDCGEQDEPEGVWWLRVKWLPPMVGRKGLAARRDVGLVAGRKADNRFV